MAIPRLTPFEKRKAKKIEDEYKKEIDLIEEATNAFAEDLVKEDRTKEELRATFAEIAADEELFDRVYEKSKKVDSIALRKSMRELLPEHTWSEEKK